MSDCANVTLEVSVGEALDKMSILSLKLRKIQEPGRKREVEKEFELIESKVSQHAKKYGFYFKILCRINENIWDKLELFRSRALDAAAENRLFREITDENDDRYRVKNKINVLCNSKIKEQKGYKLKRAFVLSHLGLGDCICMNGLVRYLATKYDEVRVVCKDYYRDNLGLLYWDDPSITFHPVRSDEEISVTWGFGEEAFQRVTEGHDVFRCGHHLTCHAPFTDLHFNFYDDMGVDRRVHWDYYHFELPEEQDVMRDALEEVGDTPYIFVHYDASTGQVFSLEEAEERFGFNHHDTLVVNPTRNMYDEGDAFYGVAERFVGHLVPQYKRVLEGASALVLADSSFFCFTICLDIGAEIRVKARSRENYVLEHIGLKNNYVFWE